MKKFFVPLFLVLLLSCSNEDFESKVAASNQKNDSCYVEDSDDFYKSISKELCKEIGGEPGKFRPGGDVSSSSDEEISSNSRSSSSRASSSSSRIGSSSSGEDDSSSSGEDNSSSSVVAGSSSSVGGAGSSSSVVVGSSSSSIGNSSSSSIGISSSSVPPSLGACSAFPYYVARAKKEYIKDLVPNNGCGNVTYTIPSGGGSSYASIEGDSISFEKATASSTPRNITIRATASVSQCNPTPLKECPITVVIADDYRDARCNHSFPPNLSEITKTTIVIDYACCEPKSDYIITQCGTANFTLSIDGSVAVTSKNNEATLPDLTPIPEPNALCTEYGASPGGILYRYPKRILMSVTNAIPAGGFSCNSW